MGFQIENISLEKALQTNLNSFIPFRLIFMIENKAMIS